jgi:hypothetical protein
MATIAARGLLERCYFIGGASAGGAAAASGAGAGAAGSAALGSFTPTAVKIRSLIEAHGTKVYEMPTEMMYATTRPQRTPRSNGAFGGGGGNPVERSRSTKCSGEIRDISSSYRAEMSRTKQRLNVPLILLAPESVSVLGA